jgi:hypothetical protein
MIKIGIIGESEGNGHPYSFTSIINGFDKNKFNKVDWPNIYKYMLENSENGKIGIEGARVEYVWCDDFKKAEKIAYSGNIKYVAYDLEELLNCDAVIIARDDWETHFKLAKMFLENGKYVFIDKPLTFDDNEIEYFKKFINNGHLFSCSALRYAPELNSLPKINLKPYDIINAFCIKNWELYSIHIIEPIFSKFSIDVTNIKMIYSDQNCEIRRLENSQDLHFNFTIYKRYNYPFLAFNVVSDKVYQVELKDHFRAFENTLKIFIENIKNNNQNPIIEFDNTRKILDTIIKGLK